MRIYNSLSKELEEFKPLQEGSVSFYVCGPTVYDRAHLGHGRSAVVFDVIRKYFEFSGYSVNYVSNYTDIDDKMINRAEEEGISVAELADRIIPLYARDYGALNIAPPTVQPKATEYVEKMVEIIGELEKRGHAYVIADDGVYFDVTTFTEYGKLSGQKLDALQVGARVAENTAKRNPYDFALWKFDKGEPGFDYWESPWGKGRPGWHIECSAMSAAILGKQFDIHGGGLDLKFPHHDCEIAQSCGAYGDTSFAQYWMHNGFITIDNEKMSKSLGNFFTLEDIFKKYDPIVVRFMFLQTHYRSPIDFSDQLLEQAQGGLERIHNFIRYLNADYSHLPEGQNDNLWGNIYLEHFKYWMNNDFNTPGALESVYSLINKFNGMLSFDTLTRKQVECAKHFLKSVDSVLGIIFTEESLELTDAQKSLIEERETARKNKDFVRSDEIRESLKKQGIDIEDTPNGPIWKKA